jgi:small conductance mechanosensitive channel
VQEELDTAKRVYDLVVDFFVNYSFQVLGALLVLALGFILSGYLARVVLRLLERKQVDVTLRKFIASVTRLLLLGCFLIIALGKFGISVAPFVAAIGALTLGAGLALQPIVSNYGAGFSIILTRPFVVGNTLTVQGVSGVVEEVKLAATILVTEDGERITIPNKHIVGEIQVNSFEHRIVETVVGIDYASDPQQAVSVLRDALERLDCVGSNPGPQVGIDGFGDSSIDIGLRFWVPTERYHEARYQANAAIWRALQDAGISIPFPRRDLRML